MLGYKESNEQYMYNFDKEQCEGSGEDVVVKYQKVFNEAEEAGSEVMFRRINCRS